MFTSELTMYPDKIKVLLSGNESAALLCHFKADAKASCRGDSSKMTTEKKQLTKWSERTAVEVELSDTLLVLCLLLPKRKDLRSTWSELTDSSAAPFQCLSEVRVQNMQNFLALLTTLLHIYYVY